jgi:phosphatidylinositol alpha-1,6-mannosyltransferase
MCDAGPRLGAHAVLVVGRMLASERYKGHDELIDAWPAVVAAIPDATLVLVGHGDDFSRLKARAAQSGAGHSIVFKGFVSDTELQALYAQAALFALPSRAEGFGLVYIEAMRHERACIGSVHDAAGDVIVDGETGLLVDQDKAGELANALVALLSDDERRANMGRSGAARVQREFSPNRFADRLIGHLETAGFIEAH